jgi:hypothetical protein
MAGVGVKGGPHLEDEDAAHAAIEDFAPTLLGLFGATKHLDAFGRARTFKLAELAQIPLGPDPVKFPEWVERLEEAARQKPDLCSREASFLELVRWFSKPAE